MKRFALLALLVIVLFSVIAPAALAQGGNPVQAAAQEYFAGGVKTIKAADLFANLNDGDASNDPFMVDNRAPEDYANGHMPGAINIPGKVLFTADGLAKLPKDKQIVLNCYSGQTASQTTAALRMMGYDAYNLLYAVPSWGTNEKVTYPFTAEQSGNYKTAPIRRSWKATFAARAAGRHPGSRCDGVLPRRHQGHQGRRRVRQPERWRHQQRPRHPGHPQCRRLCARPPPRRGQCLAQDHVHDREPGQAARRQADRFLLLLRPDRQPGHRRVADPGLRCLQHAVRHALLGDRPRRVGWRVGCEQEPEPAAGARR